MKELDINILRIRRPELANDIEKLAEWKQGEIRLFKKPYEEIRRAMKAAPDEPIYFKGMLLIKGTGQRPRSKKPQEVGLF